eukprot:CAMPEP_0172516772 /NCGR_PEP_ID=MMETSP1066-20121228/278936_1 /TAXON_ID=671091 /ORGANISM="Coscinodiscus wailesii, Strain CCMP2513" /LENGTH=101 /DNA_ID=CAMNT_0013298391 /DNA_START=128 /DNA_END=433 /DNA_ORIENTATION=+
MNFFGQKEEQKGPEPLFAATTEMEMYTHLFNNMASTCFAKCASRKHKDADITLGEMSCVDRCVGKYVVAHEKVGLILQKANESAIAQQKNLSEMQQTWGQK